MRILVVDDEPVMVTAIAAGLRRAGHAVDTAEDGAAGWRAVQINDYEVVVLDRDMPLLRGEELCRLLIERGDGEKVLMLTASGSLADRVAGLDLGADDYLAKPFSFDELLAKIRALGRRPVPMLPPIIRRGDLSIDTARQQACQGERDLELGGKELGVLVVLVNADTRWVSAEELLDKIWENNADGLSNVVRVTMVGLRRKLGRSRIETRRGVGYRLSDSAQSS